MSEPLLVASIDDWFSLTVTAYALVLGIWQVGKQAESVTRWCFRKAGWL